jgi:hypothetical protein
MRKRNDDPTLKFYLGDMRDLDSAAGDTSPAPPASSI